MKCLICDNETEHLFKGNSLCMDCILRFYPSFYVIPSSEFNNKKTIKWLRDKVREVDD